MYSLRTCFSHQHYVVRLIFGIFTAAAWALRGSFAWICHIVHILFIWMDNRVVRCGSGSPVLCSKLRDSDMELANHKVGPCSDLSRLFCKFSSVQSLSSVWLSATPGFPVHHQLSELAQTHVHRVSDAIQPSHPLSSPSPAFNLSHHQGFFLMSWFFASDGQSTGASASASALPMNIQDCFPLGLTGLISLLSKGLSRVFSKTRVQRLQCSVFFMVQLSHPYRTPGKNMWREGKWSRSVMSASLPLQGL